MQYYWLNYMYRSNFTIFFNWLIFCSRVLLSMSHCISLWFILNFFQVTAFLQSFLWLLWFWHLEGVLISYSENVLNLDLSGIFPFFGMRLSINTVPFSVCHNVEFMMTICLVTCDILHNLVNLVSAGFLNYKVITLAFVLSKYL